ncbi:MAG: hypothetical protein RIK87_14265 [Fuerstiella sp.]
MAPSLQSLVTFLGAADVASIVRAVIAGPERSEKAEELLDGYAGMDAQRRQIQMPQRWEQRRAAVTRLVDLYKRRSRSVELAVWQGKLSSEE